MQNIYWKQGPSRFLVCIIILSWSTMCQSLEFFQHSAKERLIGRIYLQFFFKMFVHLDVTSSSCKLFFPFKIHAHVLSKKMWFFSLSHFHFVLIYWFCWAYFTNMPCFNTPKDQEDKKYSDKFTEQVTDIYLEDDGQIQHLSAFCKICNCRVKN